MNGWHVTYSGLHGLDADCDHLSLIPSPAAPAGPPDACQDCPSPSTTWVELRRCLVCGRTACYESSPERHAMAHYVQTGHPVVAGQSGGREWGWCYADGLALSPGDEAGP